MAKRKRRAFTKEFKAQAVRIVRESGKAIGAVARELDLTEDGAAELGAAGGDRCRPGGAGRAHDRGAGGTRAAAAREPDAADGAGHPKKTVMGQGGPPGRMKVRYPHGAPCLEPSSRCGTASPQKN